MRMIGLLVQEIRLEEFPKKRKFGWGLPGKEYKVTATKEICETKMSKWLFYNSIWSFIWVSGIDVATGKNTLILPC